MCLLNHVHVVGSVANWEGDWLEMLFYNSDDQSLLLGIGPAADHCLAVFRYFKKDLKKLRVFKYEH